VSPVGESVKDKGDEKGHSGRLLLRMPRALHAELAQAAEKRGVSLNQLIVGLLSNALADGGGAARPGGSGEPVSVAQAERRLNMALTVNLVVLAVVGAVAVALLVVALLGGF
jgi:hypothetical protein